MAKETRIIELENDDVAIYITLMQNFGWELKTSQRIFNQNSRPVGGISYENVTYIHTETETIDFTQLTLERDTKQPHYHRLVSLEEEFMKLWDNSPDERPAEPKNILDIETWTKRNMPRIVSKAWFFIPWVILTLLMTFGVTAAIVLGVSQDSGETLTFLELASLLFSSGFVQLLLIFAGLSIPVALLIRHIKNNTLLKKLLKKHTCQSHEHPLGRLQCQRINIAIVLRASTFCACSFAFFFISLKI